MTLPEPLLRVAVYSSMFFELCDDETLAPDVAVKQLEWITADLQQLTADEQAEVVAFVEREAVSERHPERLRFLKSFPYDVGFVDEEPADG